MRLARMYIEGVVRRVNGMDLCGRRALRFFAAFLLLAGFSSALGFGQQVVQRGALGRPGQVMDETQQWSTPLLVAYDNDVEVYIPDLTSPEWLKKNYTGFMDKGQYVVSMFTFYKTPRACRANQIGWGNADAEHLDACSSDIAYRVREATVDTNQKTVTLIMAAMVGQDGQIVPSSMQQQSITRLWTDLDANTQAALKKATAMVTEQMAIYDRRMRNAH
jgi:hypothetical protein